MVGCLLLTMSALSCTRNGSSIDLPTAEELEPVTGTWVLQGQVHNGDAQSDVHRHFRLELNPTGLFTAYARAETSSDWFPVGQGAFTYSAPHISFFWDSGKRSDLLILDKTPTRMTVHHGWMLLPLKDQADPEVFVQQKAGTAKNTS
jgi:hypothetical protein